MAKRKKARKRSSRKQARRRAHVRKLHVKRGCGKRNWRRGGNAYWKCKRGKKHRYKTKRAAG